MTQHLRILFRYSFAFVAITFGALVLLPTSQGQIPTVTKKDAPKFQETISPLSEMRDTRRKVSDPTDKKLTEENKKIFTTMAQWHAYRLNMPPYNGELDDASSKEALPTDDKPIAILMNDVRKFFWVPQPGKVPNDDQAAFATEYGKAMEKELNFVLKNASKPIVRVNAARMMAMTALMPCESLADSFLAILKDEKELDAVKLYAYEGLRELMMHSDRVEPKRHLIRDPVKQAEIANVLIGTITKTYPNTTKDPEADRVVQFIRREAVRALAAFRDSVIRDRAGKVLASPALVLIRVAMADTKTSPEPSLSEQVEALIGFCSMRIDKDMEVGSATHAVNMAMRDLVRKQLPDREHPGREKSIPWKISGARITQAMNTWKTNALELPVAQEPKLIDEYAKVAIDSVLSKYEESGIAGRPDAGPLNEWFTKRALKSQQLFKNDPNSVLEWVRPVKN